MRRTLLLAHDASQQNSCDTNRGSSYVRLYEQSTGGGCLEVEISVRAEEALQIAGQTAIEFLRRHMSCDWGELSEGDIQQNEFSLKKGFRLLSNYRTAKGQQLWIITEAYRSATTVLLPSEY